MGTNYYLREDACPHCGRSDSQLHIGKSSAGWCFSLHVIPEEGLNSLEDWQKRWSLEGRRIFNEYNEEVTRGAMLDAILNRSWDYQRSDDDYKAGGRRSGGYYTSLNHFYEVNHAEPGPNNLLRHRIKPGHCIGHGEGTYDLIVGEFS